MNQSIRLPLRSYKPGQCVWITSKDFCTKENEKEEISLMIKKLYEMSILAYQYEIVRTFEVIYGEPLVIKKRLTSEVIFKLKQIMEQTGKNIEQITREIRQYLGYPCVFFRVEGQKKVPIDSQRITKAFEMVSKRASIVKVENILYF